MSAKASEGGAIGAMDGRCSFTRTEATESALPLIETCLGQSPVEVDELRALQQLDSAWGQVLGERLPQKPTRNIQPIGRLSPV